ncbi:MAG: WD40 repeat domain-containing protein [Candidatus Poribacteria bacterium]|nr:WD40 repeat domain-containing protein [Candidatus Poribacteria bacterium]
MKNVLLVPLLLVLILFTLNGYTEDYMKWGLPENATLRLGKGQIYDLKHSPDGDFIAVATSIGVWLYDADSGKEIRLLQNKKHNQIYSDWIIKLAFSPNGKILAICALDGIHLWEPHTGRYLSILREEPHLPGDLVFFPDGQTLATGTRTGGLIRFWDVTNKTISKTLTGHTKITSFAVSPDGKTIISRSVFQGKKALYWWDVETGRTIFFRQKNVDSVSPIMFSPNGKILACVGDYGRFDHANDTISLLDASNGEFLKRLRGHNKNITTLAFSPDGELLASSGSDSTIHLWNPRSGHLIHTFRGHTDRVRALSFSPDGETLVSGSWDGTIRFWDLSTKQQRLSISGHWQEVNALAFSADSKTLISGIAGSIIHKWDIETGQLKSTLVGRNDETIMAFDISRDLFASHTFGKQADDNINFRSIDTGERRMTMNTMNINTENFTFFKDQLTFSHDGTLIYTSDGKKVKYGFPLNFEFTPHDNLEESAYSKDIFKALASSPDNKLLAVATTNGVSFWKFGTNELIRLYTEVYFSLSSLSRYALAFSSDSKTLVIGDRLDIRLIEVDTGDLSTTLSGNNSDIIALAFSPNGKVLASGNEGGTILIWDLEKIRQGR